MLYFQGQVLNKENYPDEWNEYLSTVAELKKTLPKQCIFKRRRALIVMDNGRPMKAPVFLIPAKTTIQGKNGWEEWIWTKTPMIDRDGTLKWANDADAKIWIHDNDMRLDRDADIEEIYYLTQKEAMFKKGKYILEDNRKTAMALSSVEQKRAEVHFLLYHKYSPLMPDSDPEGLKIRAVASAFGIQNADNPEEWTFEQLQLELAKIVDDNEKAGRPFGIDDFIRFSNVDDEVIRRSILQRAVDHSIIYFNYPESWWKWGDSEDKILEVPSPMKQKAFIYLYQQKGHDDKFMKDVDAFLNEAPKLTPKEIDAMNRTVLMNECAKRGIASFGKKTEELKEKLKAKAC